MLEAGQRKEMIRQFSVWESPEPSRVESPRHATGRDCVFKGRTPDILLLLGLFACPLSFNERAMDIWRTCRFMGTNVAYPSVKFARITVDCVILVGIVWSRSHVLAQGVWGSVSLCVLLRLLGSPLGAE